MGTACARSPGAGAEGQAGVSCSATLLFVGGTVLSMVPGAKPANILAIHGDRVVSVGSAVDVASCGSVSRIDVRGSVILPGFIDAHSHPAAGGVEQGLAQLGEATTIDAIVATAKTWAAEHPDRIWVEGSGLDESNFAGTIPISALDIAFPDRPVLLYAADGHTAWTNTLALEMAGLLRGGLLVPDPPGGRIERDENGATGILRETAADAVLEMVPAATQSDWNVGVEFAMGELAKWGITAAVDADAGIHALRAYRRYDRRKGLSADILAAISVEPREGAAGVQRAARWNARFRSRHLRIDGVKLFVDGVIEARTAAVIEPYDNGTYGELMFSPDQLRAVVAAADARELRVHAHTIGDAAVRAFLDALEPGGARKTPLAAHVELVAHADLSRLTRLGVAANVQAVWAYRDAYLEELTFPVLNEAQGARLYPFGDFARSGVQIVAGSDWTVTTMNPWEAIEVAVTRRDPAGSGGSVLGTDQELSVERALAAYTSEAATVLGLPEVGTLEPGKRANFVVVSANPYEVGGAALGDIVVQQTWFEGRQVYQRAE